MTSEAVTKHTTKKRISSRVVANLIAFTFHFIVTLLYNRTDRSSRTQSLIKSLLFLVLLESLRWADVLYSLWRGCREAEKVTSGQSEQTSSPVDQQYIERNRGYRH